MIGAKTVASLFLLVVTLAAALIAGLMRGEVWTRLDIASLFWVGVFASVVSSFTLRFWRVYERSEIYFRYTSDIHFWGDETHFLGTREHRITTGMNKGAALELPASMHFFIYATAAFVLGMLTVDGRALELVQKLPERMTLGGTRFCPTPDVEQKRKEEVEDPGCVLLKRAYDLGYAKDLGPCEREEEDTEQKVCYLRQRDEPMLHYAWRLLNDFYRDSKSYLSKSYWLAQKKEFDQKTEHLESLLTLKRRVMGAGPRASHHIWTNLPHPQGGFHEATNNVFQSGKCLDRYRRLPHTLVGATSAQPTPSQIFEHIVAQLVFEPRYEPAAGYCREYRIHWGSPEDICLRLNQDPNTLMQQTGALRSVLAVLERYEAARTLEGLGSSLPESEDAWAQVDFSKIVPLSSSANEVTSEHLVSFQCYVEESRAEAKLRESVIVVHDQSFRLAEMRAPNANELGRFSVEHYHHVASLLAPGFSYWGYLSSASLDVTADDRTMARSLSYENFALSRLDFLSGVDVFLGQEWLLQREDLLEVYPYHTHLKNFVRVFRRHYRRERSRL